MRSKHLAFHAGLSIFDCKKPYFLILSQNLEPIISLGLKLIQELTHLLWSDEKTDFILVPQGLSPADSLLNLVLIIKDDNLFLKVSNVTATVG